MFYAYSALCVVTLFCYINCVSKLLYLGSLTCLAHFINLCIPAAILYHCMVIDSLWSLSDVNFTHSGVYGAITLFVLIGRAFMILRFDSIFTFCTSYTITIY